MLIYELENNIEYINYTGLNTMRSTLQKDLEKMGKELFLGTYQTRMGFFTKTWRSLELRYLLAFMEQMNPDSQYCGYVKNEKPVVLDEKLCRKILKGDQQLLDQVVQRTPSVYLKYGLLL